ncbi:hypothetical protein [Chondromyces crocatus]|uniref:Uncharacterized protein n=1 Tax=Chondromyces crocatus TaxID=52 RepID=A0A0K1E846_CHOCO|nr:hypothetical protein [Chondromyces crocatus]AKT36857.1 uncharacterized protein CMC5_009780 [Chondromyces crocatus]
MDGRHLQAIAALREELERTVDGRERRRFSRALCEATARLGAMIEDAARLRACEEREYLV